jgi:parvulin-like peptidyl-prolyl isomerase
MVLGAASILLKKIQINGELLDPAEVRARASELRREREAAGLELDLEQRLALQEEALEILVDRTLLVQAARRLGLAPGESEIAKLLQEVAGRFDGVAGCRAGMDTPESREDLSRRVMVDRILDRWRASVRAPGAEELRSYYRRNKEHFYTPELIQASHFVRSCESAVQRAYERVLAGEDFAAVAADCSDCPENGGDLGWFGRGVMVEDFDRAVFISPVNQLTAVFRTVFGFHFAVVHERRPEGIRPFDEVRPEVARSLLLAKQDREVGRQLAEMRARAVIKVIR